MNVFKLASRMALLGAVAIAIVACDEPSEPLPTATPPGVVAVIPAPTPEPTSTLTPTPTATPEPTSTPTLTPTPTATPEPTSTLTPTARTTSQPTATPIAQPTLWPLITMQGAPNYVKWKIGSGVKPEYVEDSVEGVRLMDEYIESLDVPGIEAEVHFHLFQDQHELAAAYEAATGAKASRGDIEAFLDGEGYIFVNTLRLEEWKVSSEFVRRASAHEMVHALQYELAGVRYDTDDHTIAETGPFWVIEGIAEFLAYQAMAAAGVLSYDTIRNSTDSFGIVEQSKRDDTPLSEMETLAGSSEVRGDPWIYFLLAAELLASRTGQSSLIHYYSLLQPGTTWQEAFEQAFGVTAEEFYELFEAHRAADFPDPAGPTPTPTPAGAQTVDDYIVWKVGDEVSSTSEAETRETVLAVHDYAVGIGMPRIDRPITIFLYHDLGSLEAAFEAATGHEFEDWVGPDFAAGADPIMASRDFIALNTSAGGYRQQSPDQRKEELISLLFDVYRRALTGIWQGTPRDAVDPEGPQWLRAGSREYLTAQVLRAPGLESCDPTRGSYALRIARSGGAPLSELETRAGSASVQSSGAYGFLALEVLAEQSGQESIMSYFASLRTGVTWQEAFQTNFGMTVAEFYQLFEERRAAGFPDWDCSSARQPSTPTGLPLVAMPGVPHYLRWYIGPNVPQVYVEEMKKGARLVHEYATSWGLREFQRQIRIYLVGDLDTLTVIFSELVGGAAGPLPEPWKTSMALAGNIGVGDDAWIIMNAFHQQYASTDPKYRTKIAAHELFHGYQNTLSSFAPGTTEDSVPYNGPRWLAEGTAEFFSYKALDAEGTLTYEEERMASGRGFVARARGVEPALKRPQLGVAEPVRVPLIEPLENGCRAQLTICIGQQQRNDIALPHVRERVWSASPSPSGLLPLRRQRSTLPLPCRSLAHGG